MTEKQTLTQNNGATQTQIDFNTLQKHLEALSDKFVRLLGDKYALPKPREGNDSLAFATHCVYFTHNEKHEDENPSAWVKVFLSQGQLASGCSKCGRAQVVTHNDKWQPAPTLKTLSHGDERLLQTLLDLGCKEFPLTEEEAKTLEVELPEEERRKRQPRVGFPVVYADGSMGFHFRVALEGKEKWRHMEGGKAGEAVFGLYHQEIQRKIQSKRMVIVTESPYDPCVLFAAGLPAIGGAGCGNTPKALACEQHRQTLLNLLSDDGEIFVWVEPDAPDFAQKVANALQRPVKVIKPPVPEDDPKKWKDAKRLWLDYCGKDWEKFEVVVKELLANATEIAPQPEPVFEPKIVKVKRRLEEAVWQPLGEMTMPENDRWQVEGLIKEGNLVILSARPKTAKSIVALNLAACVAMGKPFLDRSVTQGRALFVAYERFELTLKRAWVMGLAGCDYFMLWNKRAYGLPRVDYLDGWLNFMERYDIKLVVFDTLAHFLKPELAKVRNGINAYDHVYNLMETLQSAAEDTGRTIVLIHHDRKGETAETDEARVLGTTALTASVDVVLQLKPMSDDVICLKASGNAIEDTVLFFKVGQDFWLELTDKPATTKEERAAREIEGYLRQHGEATRQDLIRLLLETGLAGKESAASMLLQRAFEDYLSLRVEKRYEGKQVVYRLKGGSSLPNLPPARSEIEPADSPEAARCFTPTTPIEVVNVVNRQPDQPDPTLNTLNTINTLNNDRHVKGVKGQPEPNPQPDRPLTTLTNPIGVAGVNNDPQCSPPEPERPVGDLPDDESPQPDRPETAGSQTEPDLLGNPQGNPPAKEPDPQSARPEPAGNPTEPTEPVSDPQATVGDLPDDNPPAMPVAPTARPQGCPPDLEPDPQPTDPFWLVFDGVLPELVVGCPPDLQGNPPAKEPDPQPDRPAGNPTEPERPVGDPSATVEVWDYDRVYGDLPDDDGSPPDNDPQAAQSEPAGSPAGDQQPNRKPKAKDLLVSYKAEVITEPVCPVCETELEPERNRKAACLGCGRLYFVVAPTKTPQPAREHEGNPTDLPANEPDIEFMRINSISANEPEGNPPAMPVAPTDNEPEPAVIKRVEGGCVVVATADWVEDSVVVVTSDDILFDDGSDDIPTEPARETENELAASVGKVEGGYDIPPEPAGSPQDSPAGDLQDEPVATLTEPICPYCGEWLEPDPESGLATCAGCGRLFEVETPPDDDGSDDNPPESPDSDGGSPPKAPSNGHDGSKIGFAPPKDFAIPPAFQPKRIYSDKFVSPAILNRMTVRQPDGSIKLAWDDTTETVAPNELDCWQPIETIPSIDLPEKESVEIPPVVVLDLETDGLDPLRGRILAAGLALFVEGEAKEMTIIYNNEANDDGEGNLLLQVFGWLRDTYERYGNFILTGYNMFDFDLRCLIERSRRLGLKRECLFDYERDKNGKIKRLPIPDTDGKYTYTAIKTSLPIRLIDTQHLVIRWDEFERVLTDYSLKTAAEHFEVNIPNRPKLSPEEIVHAFFNDRATFNAYLFADLRETYALFDILIEPYLGIAASTDLSFDLEDLARNHGRGWVWEQHYRRHYTEIPEADEIRKYRGGLVVCRKGLWFNCAKFDIASLYPTIILAYRIHSRKDPLQIGLRYLKTYWEKRLLLKQIANETGDRSAQIKQSGLKVLTNSHYGHFGSKYKFNDINAAERVTEIGRKILTRMIAAVEDMGLLVVEADTDGIIVACQDRDPEEIRREISKAIPPVFKVELEWQGRVVFVSEKKNYMVFEPNGDLALVKGGKWRGRDKPAFQTKAIPEFVKRWFTQSVEAALEYARQILEEIQSGNGWRWVVCTRRVSVNDKSLQAAGFKVGEKATFAYKRKTSKSETTEIALKPNEGYDCKYYAGEFSDLVKEVIEAIDPAQIEAWERMVASEARPLIFATQ